MLPTRCFLFVTLLAVLDPIAHAEAVTSAVVLRAVDFGLSADGATDDGPAIRRLVEAVHRTQGPVTVQFPEHAQVAVVSGTDRYVFNFNGDEDICIDGRGTTFLLDPHLRFLNAFDCRNLKLQQLQVDYLRQPTTSGVIQRVDPAAKSLTVRLDDPSLAARLGGPTGEDGEQAFFGMIHLDCLYGMKRVKHFFVDSVSVEEAGLVQVCSPESDFHFLQPRIKPGQTRIGLPVPGVAHRHGPGALFIINACDGVALREVEVWSAPWFAFQIFRNRGPVTFDQVHVRPKPGSGKVLASCRDAYHAKGNRGKLLFKDCILKGLGDDAFNLSTHCSRIRKVLSPTEIEIRQHFPIQYIPIEAGDTLVAMSAETNEVLGESVIATVQTPSQSQENLSTRENRFVGRAPVLKLTLQTPLPRLARSHVVWTRESANPDSEIRNCTIRRSCRFQTNVKLICCDVEAFLTFYGDNTEGPGAERVEIRDCTLKSASWQPTLQTAVSMSGFEGSEQRQLGWDMTPESTLRKSVRITNNEIWGCLRLNLIHDLELQNNRILLEHGKPIDIGHVTTQSVGGNRVVQSVEQLSGTSP